MKADSITIQDFFHTERRHLVPLYQRPYVWTRDGQWEPLWEDLRDLAERTLDGRTTRPHFLGAIVLDQIKTPIKDVPARLVIDGQQRLTTLQLLMGALRDLFEELGEEDLRKRLDRLTRNDDAKDSSEQRFKVWPTNVDRVGFAEMMESRSGQPPGERIESARSLATGDGLIVDAYAYFRKAIGTWLRERDKEGVPGRSATLVDVLRHRVSLVVIDLGDDDEAQVIFETLNARGTPLLPADLVKNHLFHAAEAHGVDIDSAYERYWKPFDQDVKYWRKDVQQGRLYRPRIDLFLQHYLTVATRDEVSATHLFSEFKAFTSKRPDLSPEDHLRELHGYAAVYRRLSEFSEATPRGVFFKRLDVMETTTLVPFLLALFHRYAKATEQACLDAILADLESYLVRRMVCQMTTKNYNQFFLELLGVLDRAGDAAGVAGEVRRLLMEQSAESRLWPDDDAFSRAWRELPAYRALSRARLRMVLEAIEAGLRSEMSESIVINEKLTVEHLLPQAWQEHWPPPNGADPTESATRRDALLHRFGNLTLLTKKLNPAISNGAWSIKHPKICEHSALALNRALQKQATWDDGAIVARTETLFQKAVELWPRPRVVV